MGVKKGLTTREIELSDALCLGFLEPVPNGFQGQEAESVIVRTATNKAVAAGEIASGPSDLEPQGIQFS